VLSFEYCKFGPKSQGNHAAAGFHFIARRFRCGLAARGARAAGEAADHRVFGREHVFELEPLDQLLREVLPGLRRLAIIANIGNSYSALEIAEAQAAARKLGVDVDVLEIRRAEEIAPAFETLKSGVQALYVCPDPLVNANHARINTLALGARLPTIHPFRDYLGAGGFMSYGANNADLFRRAGDFVDKILRGAKPADLPIEQPTKFDLVINLTTAKALGVKIPEAFLQRADEVIE